MVRIYAVLVFLCGILNVTAQDSTILVRLDGRGRDDRFEKFMLTMPVFNMRGDTMLTMDFEDMRPAKKVIAKRPPGYKDYGYGYLFFTGVVNEKNPGYTNMLIAGLYDPQPFLYIDRNNNFDFTDDGGKLPLPVSKNDSLVFTLSRNTYPAENITIRLRRLDFQGQPKFRSQINDYYAYFYKDRVFAGVDRSYREQRYISKCGIVKSGGDSFRIALYDGNSNGLYNEPDSDRIITANINDTIFESRDDLHSFIITRQKMYVEYNGEQFEVLEIDRAGTSVKLKQLSGSLLLGRIKPGKRIPKFNYTTWNGDVKKIKKLRKHNVYLYFTGPNVKNFSRDTAALRKIADANPGKIKVIAFIDVNKSYELKIFGTYSNLNYDAAYRDKDLVRKLALRGLPTSIWLCGRRKVVEYNVKPEDFLAGYEKRHAARK